MCTRKFPAQVQLSLSSFATLFQSVAKCPNGQGSDQMEYAPGEATSCPTGASDGHSRGNVS